MSREAQRLPALDRRDADGGRSVFSALDGSSRDARYALRSLGKSRGFTGTALLILALYVGASLVLNRLMTSLLFKVSPYDAANLIGTALLLLGIGIGSSMVPAWRAARVNPVIALRTE